MFIKISPTLILNPEHIIEADFMPREEVKDPDEGDYIINAKLKITTSEIDAVKYENEYDGTVAASTKSKVITLHKEDAERVWSYLCRIAAEI